KDYRGYLRRILVGTAGEDAGDDPAAWKAWWARAGEAAVAREETRRDVRRLGKAESHDAARERLRRRGKDAARALIDALGTPAGDDAAAILKEISGKDLGTDRAAWEAWWREEAQR